jgi:hypothetical protein
VTDEERRAADAPDASAETAPTPDAGEPTSAWRRVVDRIPRRRLALLALVPCVLLVGRELFGTMPHDVDIELRWREPGVDGLVISYEQGDELVQQARFAVPAGSRRLRHTPHLPAGRYRVRIDPRGSSSYREIVRRVDSPSDGTVILGLGDDD